MWRVFASMCIWVCVYLLVCVLRTCNSIVDKAEATSSIRQCVADFLCLRESWGVGGGVGHRGGVELQLKVNIRVIFLVSADMVKHNSISLLYHINVSLSVVVLFYNVIIVNVQLLLNVLTLTGPWSLIKAIVPPKCPQEMAGYEWGREIGKVTFRKWPQAGYDCAMCCIQERRKIPGNTPTFSFSMPWTRQIGIFARRLVRKLSNPRHQSLCHSHGCSQMN